jgi:hypothetical protein
MWRGYCAVGLAPESGWLPVNLVTAADHWLHINPLLIHCATKLALGLTGTQPTVTLAAADAAAAGPRLLRFARRTEQTADAYLSKLRELVQAAVPLPPAAHPAVDSVQEGITLQDLAGMDEAVAWGEMLRDDLTASREKRRSWADVDRGVLLSGPLGCCETTYAQALARTCDVPLVQGSWSRWLANGAGHPGNFMNTMKKTFAEAREKRMPCILFLDKVDSFPNRSTHTQAWCRHRKPGQSPVPRLSASRAWVPHPSGEPVRRLVAVPPVPMSAGDPEADLRSCFDGALRGLDVMLQPAQLRLARLRCASKLGEPCHQPCFDDVCHARVHPSLRQRVSYTVFSGIWLVDTALSYRKTSSSSHCRLTVAS